MEGIRAFSSMDRSNQLQSITIMLLQEEHITTFTQAAGAVLKDVVHTAEIKQATASDKQIKLPTAATRSRDSDNEVQLDQPIGQLLPPAPVPNGDADNDFLDLDEPLRQVLPPAPVPNGKSDDPIDADMHTCKEPPAPYWIWSFVSRTKNSWQRGPG